MLLALTLEVAADRGYLDQTSSGGSGSTAATTFPSPLNISPGHAITDDAVIAKPENSGAGGRTKGLSMGPRWPVEPTNSWVSNYGITRPNTDRKSEHRLTQLCLVVVF